MLIFKNNLYDTQSPGKSIPSPCPDPDYNSCFDPLHLIEVGLSQEEEVLSFIERQPQMYRREDYRQF